MMTLLEITERLKELNREHTIYAAKPWSPNSATVVVEEPQRGGSLNAASVQGMPYFLEVFIAQDILNDWQTKSSSRLSTEERCQRLIEYAINDA